MPEYEFLYIVRIVGIKAANHAKSMERDVKITVTVDGEPWPISKPEWDRTYDTMAIVSPPGNRMVPRKARPRKSRTTKTSETHNKVKAST